MRVLFFNYEYPPLGGGAANATEQLFLALKDQEDLVIDLVTSAIDDKQSVEYVGTNITIYRIPIGKNEQNLNYQSHKELITYSWKALFFSRTLMRKYTYDLTHSFFTLPCGMISLFIKLFYRKPYVVSLRGADVPGYSERFVLIYRFFTPLIRFIWWRASHVVTNSRGLTELAQKAAPNQKFLEIFNGIDVQYFTPSNRSIEIKERDFVILCAARLTYRKGFLEAIEGFATIAEKYAHVRMIVAGGDGGMMRRLKGHAQALSVQHRISFPGYYTKQMAPEMYREADVFLMPSHNEGMSNNVLEALASGLPLLMTPTGGCTELVHEGKNGHVIAFHSSDDIAAKLESIITQPAKAFAMGKESRKIAENLSWQKAADAYYALYKDV